MGIAASWIALKGVDKAEAFERLGFLDMGEPGELYALEPSYAEMPGGWLVILSPEYDDAWPKQLAALSVGGEALACAIEEHVMCSVAWGYAGGREVWSLDHDPDKGGIRHLAVTGAPPAELDAIREAAFAEQAEEDRGRAMADYVFSVPVDLVYALCGFRADGTEIEGGDPQMTLLEPIRPAKRAAPAASSGGGLFKSLAGLFKRG